MCETNREKTFSQIRWVDLTKLFSQCTFTQGMPATWEFTRVSNTVSFISIYFCAKTANCWVLFLFLNFALFLTWEMPGKSWRSMPIVLLLLRAASLSPSTMTKRSSAWNFITNPFIPFVHFGELNHYSLKLGARSFNCCARVFVHYR